MRTRTIIPILILTAGLAAEPAYSSVDSAGVRRQVPGSPLWLTPPPNFLPTRMFAGFLDRSTGASIAAENLVGGFEAHASYYTDSVAMGKLGARIMMKQYVSTPTLRRLLILMQYGKGTGAILKWLLLCGDSQEAQLLYASFLVDDEWRLSEPLRKALLGSEWVGKRRSVDVLEGFAVRVRAERGLVPVMRAGNLVVYSTGKAPSLMTDVPQYVIELRPAIAPDSTMVIATTRHAAIEKKLDLRNFTIEWFRPVSVRGFLGYETLARGTDARGKQVVYYETFLNGKDGGVTLTGLASGPRAQSFGSSFQTMTRSIIRTGDFNSLF